MLQALPCPTQKPEGKSKSRNFDNEDQTLIFQLYTYESIKYGSLELLGFYLFNFYILKGFKYTPQLD